MLRVTLHRMTWRAMSAGPTHFEPSCVEMRVKWHRMMWREISPRPYQSVVFGTKKGVECWPNTVDHAADTRGPGRMPGASLYTREVLPPSRGAGRKPGASLYTRERHSLSRGAGRKPGASVYTQKRLSLSHATDLIIAGVMGFKVGLGRFRLRLCSRRVMRLV